MATVYGSTTNYYKAFLTYSVTETNTDYKVSVSGAGPKCTANTTPTWGNWRLKMTATGKDTSYKPSSSGWTNHSVSPGVAWDMLGSKTYTFAKGTSSKSVTVKATVYYGSTGTSSVASKTFTVPALKSYSVKYNANGGSGAPSSQTKYYNTNLTLSTKVPTKTGHTLKTGTERWRTTASGSGDKYASGGTYTANASVTLYAQWTPNTYTVSYNANGGSGAPSNQTKTYGTTLKLSSTKPTRSGYSFSGWNTSSAGTGTKYLSGGNYTANAAVTLYAQWTQEYMAPEIGSIEAVRVNSNGEETLSGEYVDLSFVWEAGRNPSDISYSTTVSVVVNDVEQSNTYTTLSGSFTSRYTIGVGDEPTATITLTDNIKSESITTTKVLPKGGLILHISPNEKSIAMFGFADESKEGLDVDSNIYAQGSAYLSNDIHVQGTMYSPNNKYAITGYSTDGTPYGVFCAMSSGNNVILGNVNRPLVIKGSNTGNDSGLILGSTGNLNVSGYIYCRDHDSAIGDRQAMDYATTKATGDSFVDVATSSVYLQLSAGVYVVHAMAEFGSNTSASGGNSTGRRALRIYGSEAGTYYARSEAANGAIASVPTRVRTVFFPVITASSKLTFQVYQNSGSTLQVHYYIESVRIR